MLIHGIWLPSGETVTSPEQVRAPEHQGETLWLHAQAPARLRGVHRNFVSDAEANRWLSLPHLKGVRSALLHQNGDLTNTENVAPEASRVVSESSHSAGQLFDWRTVEFEPEGSQVSTSDLLVFWTDQLLFTITAGTDTVVQQIMAEQRQTCARLMAASESNRLDASSILHESRRGIHHTAKGAVQIAPSVVAHLMRLTVSKFMQVEQDLASALTAVENQVFSPDDNEDLAQIYRLKREVLEAQRAATNNLSSLEYIPSTVFTAPLMALSSTQSVLQRSAKPRVLTLMQQISRRLEDDSKLISDIVSVHLSKVSVQQNDDMRRISAWAAIFAVPTMIAGIYGMNFKDMPELKWHLGYPLCILVIAASTFVLYRLFKRSGWL